MGIIGKNRRTKSRSAAATLIAKGCVVSGKLKLENDIQVDGVVDGQLHIEGTLVIAEAGHVKGEVFAKQIIVNGNLEGECHAQHVQILAKGQVKGKISSHNLSIEPGGKFFGETAELPKEEVVAINSNSAASTNNTTPASNAANTNNAKNKDVDANAKKPERALKTA